MEKYGVESVQEGQRAALQLARAKLMRLGQVLEKTASEAQEESELRSQISDLEAALASQ